MQNAKSQQKREKILQNIQTEGFDLTIIGGGISGLAAFRDASRRGLKTLLVEKGDFCSGTSSRSSKLVHGGLRYLETWNWSLVFESCRERARLLENAPSLVKPLRFFVPVYQGDKRPLWMVQIGVWLYHFLALFRDMGHPKRYSKASVLRILPTLNREDLKGAVSYSDGLMNDVELGLANLRSGWEDGGVALNHIEAVELKRESETSGQTLRIKDRLKEEEFTIHTKWVLNTTGPWAGAQTETLRSEVQLRPTKGVHLLFPRSRIPIEDALLLTSPDDQRVAFAIPWEDVTMIGTTDTDFNGDPDDVKASEEDVAYLLRIAQKYFPGQSLKEEDVMATFAGLRPLIDSTGTHDPSAVSREHSISIDRPGFVSLLGGKYTTFRQMSEEAIDRIVGEDAELGQKARPCDTANAQLSEEIDSLLGIEDEIIQARIRRMIEEELAATPWDVLGNRSFLAFLDLQKALQLLPYVKELLPNLPSWAMEEFDREIAKTRSGLSVDKPS